MTLKLYVFKIEKDNLILKREHLLYIEVLYKKLSNHINKNSQFN
jgi:hypothetical protein